MAKTNQKSRRVQTSGKIGAGSPSVLTDAAEISALLALPAEDKNVTSLYIVADNSDHVARSPIPFKSVENILQASAFASAIDYGTMFSVDGFAAVRKPEQQARSRGTPNAGAR